MPSNQNPTPSPTPLSPSKKARLIMDEAIVEMTLHNGKVRADEIEVYNGETGLLLQFPQGLLERIYDYVYSDQTFQLALSDCGKARISHLTHRFPLALPSTCRKLRQDTINYPYTKTTFRIVTFKFISMFDTCRVAIRHNPNILLDFLESVPAPWMQHIEVIGVARGPRSLDIRDVIGHEQGVDYEAELEETIRLVYPEATFALRAEDRIEQI